MIYEARVSLRLHHTAFGTALEVDGPQRMHTQLMPLKISRVRSLTMGDWAIVFQWT